MALKAAAVFTDGFDMPEAGLEPEEKVSIAEEMGELIEQGIELSLHDDATLPSHVTEIVKEIGELVEQSIEPPLPPPPEPPFELVLPPAWTCKLSKPFNDLFKMKGDEELQNQLLMLRDEQIDSQKFPDYLVSWATEAVTLFSPQEERTAMTVNIV